MIFAPQLLPHLVIHCICHCLSFLPTLFLYFVFRETILIDGLESIFSTSTGSGWVKCVVSLDLLHMQMVVNYGEKEERSPHLLLDLGLSLEEIMLPPGPLHFTVDVLRIDPESVSLEGEI